MGEEAKPFTETIIPAHGVRSLVWSGDTLIDWAAGGVMYHPDGTHSRPSTDFGSEFDRAISFESYVVVYTRVGTKALLLKDGKPLRELKRQSYHAEAYEYPLCIAEYEGRALLIHCPDVYCMLEIEDADTGERLTSREVKNTSYFHSRLSVSPDGRRLLTAGWVWQPWDAVAWYDLAEALRNPAHLDSLAGSLPTTRNVCLAEEGSACWQSDDVIIVTATSEAEDPSEADLITGPRLKPNGIVAYDTRVETFLSECVLEKPAGIVMPVGSTHVMAFYEHPRLVRLADGAVEFSLPGISSGEQHFAITWSYAPPILALDPKNVRFAIVQDDAIHVVTVHV